MSEDETPNTEDEAGAAEAGQPSLCVGESGVDSGDEPLSEDAKNCLPDLVERNLGSSESFEGELPLDDRESSSLAERFLDLAIALHDRLEFDREGDMSRRDSYLAACRFTLLLVQLWSVPDDDRESMLDHTFEAVEDEDPDERKSRKDFLMHLVRDETVGSSIGALHAYYHDAAIRLLDFEPVPEVDDGDRPRIILLFAVKPQEPSSEADEANG